jgi:methylamine dehydrogenase accessory protein MauD
VQGWWAASYVLLWLLVLALCAVVVALARQIGMLHLRLGPRGALEIDDEGPDLGEPPPAAIATTGDGADVSLAAPGRGRLVLFVSPGCVLCQQVLPGLGPVASAAGYTAYAVSDLDLAETRRIFASAPPGVRVLSGPEAARAWKVPGTPFAVVVDEAGVVRAKGTPNNLEQLEGLVDSARHREEPGAPSVAAGGMQR